MTKALIYWPLFTALVFVASTLAPAAQYKSGVVGGVMTQPTSNYLHAVYGGYGEVGMASERYLLRFAYIERPLFKANGFQDQEYNYFGVLGTKAIDHKWHGLYSYIGFGEIGGFIEEAGEKRGDYEKRTYKLPGLVLLLDYAMRLKKLELAAGHQVFIGYTSNSHLEAYVAWPYSFLYFRIGMSV